MQEAPKGCTGARVDGTALYSDRHRERDDSVGHVSNGGDTVSRCSCSWHGDQLCKNRVMGCANASQVPLRDADICRDEPMGDSRTGSGMWKGSEGDAKGPAAQHHLGCGENTERVSDCYFTESDQGCGGRCCADPPRPTSGAPRKKAE